MILQTDYGNKESFIRYGPIQRLKNSDERRVGVFPWRTNGSGSVVKRSASPHVAAIVKFIKRILDGLPRDESFRVDPNIQNFFVILWVLNLVQAIPLTALRSLVKDLRKIEAKELKDKLYCMKLAGWVNWYSYGGDDYWYSTSTDDPVSKYSFKSGGAGNDPHRRKSEASSELFKLLKIPTYVRDVVANKKMASQ